MSITSTTSSVQTTSSAASAFLTRLNNLFPSTLVFLLPQERVVKVAPRDLIPLLTFLKNHTGREFTQLVDLTAIDWPERKNRFEVVYCLLSVRTATRLTVSVSIPEGTSIPSVTTLYPSAGWFEREVFDRFGVTFTDHPDLRPRLSDYGFRGHPLRKDFPLTGYTEVRYSETGKRIQREPVSLPQEFRQFTLDNPWSN